MKITKTAVSIFFLAFLIGCFSFASYIYVKGQQKVFVQEDKIPESAKKVAEVSNNRFTPQIEMKVEQSEDEDWTEQLQNYKVKLLMPGIFHDDEVTAKSGEKWLGLFREKNNYFLRFTKINVSRVRDEIVDGDSKEKTGKKVSVGNSNQPIFLLKNVWMLNERKVTTLFRSKEDEENNLPNNYIKNFSLNKKTYTLKVISDQSEAEYLDETSKLILVSGDKQQIIYSGGCDDCSWQLYWAGDLDNDGKLDLYANLTNHYNASSPMLFLSSQAEKGKLLKDVARFLTVGC